MEWKSLASLASGIPMPSGYTLEELKKTDVPGLISSLREWYPDIVVGSESCHLIPRFYEENAFFRDEGGNKPVFAAVVVDSQKKEKAGLITLEKNDEALTITSRLGALAPQHRGKGLVHFGPALVEAMGRAMGAELAYYFVTLKIPHQQVGAEKAGFKLVGIAPGYDQDMVSPGTVRRVYEGIYAKVLVGEEHIFYPPAASLTPRTRALWDFLFQKELL